MDLPTPITIVSDLHWGHPLGRVRRAVQIAGLIRGSASVVFNGDSVEARREPLRTESAARLEEMCALCRELGAQPVFVTGNHDPRISDVHALELLDGAVLVTHGDALFNTLTPWSRFAPALRRRFAEETARMGAGVAPSLEMRLEIARRLSEHAPHLEGGGSARDPHSSAAHYAAEFLHPFRPLAVLRCWMEAPGRAVALAERWRPRARVILIGHTHLPGCWRRRGRWVINTGGFAPVRPWALAARIDRGGIELRSVVPRRGDYLPGRVRRRIPLPRAGAA